MPATTITSQPVGRDSRGDQRIRAETLGLLFVTVGCAVVANLYPSAAALPGLFSLVGPIVYLLVERRVRHRSWSDLGIRFQGIGAALRSNWWLLLLVVVVLQVASVLLAKAFWPEMLTHVSGRIPAMGQLPVLVPLIIVLTLREEVVFRGLFQERVGWFFGQVAAIVGVSVLFALTHTSRGVVAVVLVDLLFIFFDSLVYGVIYSRSRNVFVSWVAHAGSDLVGVALLILVAAGS